MPMDELDNDQLAEMLCDSGGRYLAEVSDELQRVEAVQKRHALTGADLSYWFEREEILRQSVYDAV